jgi:hypothetical protein
LWRSDDIIHKLNRLIIERASASQTQVAHSSDVLWRRSLGVSHVSLLVKNDPSVDPESNRLPFARHQHHRGAAEMTEVVVVELDQTALRFLNEEESGVGTSNAPERQ